MTALHPPIVMVGLPGVGKSKVGRLLAASLGLEYVDTDAIIEADAGRSISQIFADEGEAGFREREVQAVAKALAGKGVVSLGGGAVTSPRVRELLRGVDVVHIDVEHDELVRRVSRKNHRPLLREDPAGALRRLRAEREPLYAEVETVRVASDDGPVEEVAERIAAMISTGFERVRVTGAPSYDVLIGRRLPSALVREALRPEATKALIIHAEPVADAASRLADELLGSGLDVALASHPNAEAGKSLDVVAGLWDLAGRLRLGRADAIIAMGGGATTDMAGFVAATWLRGIDLVTLPTTLLAMVDAAVGGKTGINTAVGKNLVGSFHAPVRVICDLARLDSLPSRDLAAGLGEAVKCGFIDDAAILDLVEAHGPEELLDPTASVLEEIVVRAVSVKARVVSEDLRESGLREILNYGHTFAHAIERAEDYSWRHGDAVAVGCVFAAELGADRGLLTADEVEAHRRAFAKIGLPIAYEGAPLSDLIEIMLSDKKVRAGVPRFVLLEGLQNPVRVAVEPDELIGPAARIGVRGE